VDNRSGTLLPGAYVRVHLKLPQSVNSVTVPANTLLFRSEGLRVGVVRNGRAELVPVTIGRDYGNSVVVVSGLQPTDPDIHNPRDSLISGTTVQVNAPPAQAGPLFDSPPEAGTKMKNANGIEEQTKQSH
jgi:hypothetical protein